MGSSPDSLLEKAKGKADVQQALQDRTAQENANNDKYNKYMQDAQAQRNADLAAGQARGQQLFGAGSLGRVEAGRAGEISDIISMRQKQLGGFTPEEMQVGREQNAVPEQQALQGRMRQLQVAQANSGVRGPAAAAQQARALMENQGQRAGNERDIFLANMQRRQEAGNALENSVRNAEASETQKQQFNLGQASREKMGQLASEMGYGSLGAGERASVMQRLVGEQQAESAKNSANQSGGKK